MIKPYLILKGKFQALPRTKKQLFLLMAVGLGIFLYFLLLEYPLSKAIEDLKSENANKQKLLLWVRKTAKEIKGLKKNELKIKEIESDSLLTLIDQEAKKPFWKAYAVEMKKMDNKQVEISFKAVVFNDLIGGLQEISEKYKIEVVKISIHRTKNENWVNATVLLKG